MQDNCIAFSNFEICFHISRHLFRRKTVEANLRAETPGGCIPGRKWPERYTGGRNLVREIH